MKKIAIKGSLDPKKQKEIIKILKSLGGENARCYDGNSPSYYYYIGNNNIIEMAKILSSQEYELLTLKQYKEKYMNTETKEFKIEIPEGYEVDKENSTFEKIIFKKVEEKLTYEKIAEKLFKFETHYYIDSNGVIRKNSAGWKCPNAAPTSQQLEKLLALNKLMNVAYYLNDGWEPNWNDGGQEKFYIYYNSAVKTLNVSANFYYNGGVVYFKSKEIAKQAIQILGEDIVKLALGI